MEYQTRAQKFSQQPNMTATSYCCTTLVWDQRTVSFNVVYMSPVLSTPWVSYVRQSLCKNWPSTHCKMSETGMSPGWIKGITWPGPSLSPESHKQTLLPSTDTDCGPLIPGRSPAQGTQGGKRQGSLLEGAHREHKYQISNHTAGLSQNKLEPLLQSLRSSVRGRH